jgi:probable phosphoglycerate mutase
VTDSADKSYRQYRFAPPPGATELLLVRHGESAPARADDSGPRLDGQADPDLTPDGIEQAERIALRLAGERIDAVYVTTLRRTQETAEPLVRKLGLTPQVDADLREVFLGEWEGGLFRKNIQEQHPLAVRMWTEERWDVIPGAETTDAFRGRLDRAVRRIAEAHPDQRVAVFTHGGVIGALLAMACGSRAFAFVGADNGSISHLVITQGHWMVRRYNDTAHLAPSFSLVAEPLT